MKVSEVLTDARETINEGWCQHMGRDRNGNYCALGALRLAEDRALLAGHDGSLYGGRFACEYLDDHLPEFGQYESIVAFNDNPFTKQQDVLNLFDKAIASAQEKGL